MRTTILYLLAVPAFAACTSLDTAPAVDNGTRLQVVNGALATGPVDVWVDGSVAIANVGVAATRATLEILPGVHEIRVTSVSGGSGYTRFFALQLGVPVTVIAVDTTGGVTPAILSDTNAVVPAGASKLRVAHMASNAGPISIWRTQPDFATPSRVQFPFAYHVTSPYMQSTPGDWRVLVSSEDNTAASVPMPDTLAMSAPIGVPDGGSRTIVVLDGPAGGLVFVVVNP